MYKILIYFGVCVFYKNWWWIIFLGYRQQNNEINLFHFFVSDCREIYQKINRKDLYILSIDSGTSLTPKFTEAADVKLNPIRANIAVTRIDFIVVTWEISLEGLSSARMLSACPGSSDTHWCLGWITNQIYSLSKARFSWLFSTSSVL